MFFFFFCSTVYPFILPTAVFSTTYVLCEITNYCFTNKQNHCYKSLTFIPSTNQKNGLKSEHESQFLTVIISHHLGVILFRFIDPCTVTLLKKHT